MRCTRRAAMLRYSERAHRELPGGCFGVWRAPRRRLPGSLSRALRIACSCSSYVTRSVKGLKVSRRTVSPARTEHFARAGAHSRTFES